MEIEVSQEKLAKALNNVSRIAVGRTALPILSNVLIRVEKKKVSLVTTNLDMAVVDFLPVSNSKDGVITIPAKLLAEYVSTLPKGETIKLSSKDNKITISANKYSSTINGSPADDFPELPEINEKEAVVFKIGIDEFKNSINQVVIASSNDLTRPALTGVFFNTYDKILAIAATDGYRLAEKKLIKDVQSEIQVIVPTNSLQEVLRAVDENMEEVEISFNDDLVRFRLGEIEIISKIIDASFPDYKKLIPKDNNIKLTLDKEELIRDTKLAALFARRSAGGSIVLEAKKPDTFSIRSVANELGENDSIIESKIEEEGKINLNSRFLLDALNVIEEKDVNLEFANRINPIILTNKKSSDYTHIIMPLNS